VSTLLQVERLSKRFEGQQQWFATAGNVTALRDISFTLDRGKTLAVVGESGSGKSTLARILVGLETPSDGAIKIDNLSIADNDKAAKLSLRKNVRMIFQDPSASLNPRVRVGEQLDQALQYLTRMGPRQRQEAVNDALLKVGLQPDLKSHFPHQFSGGQRQRIAIARAILPQPQLVIADEPVSTLDASVQAQIINLLLQLQADLGLSYVYISHDLGVVKHVSDEVLVLYGGVVMEYGKRSDLFANPLHPYTQILINSSPSLQHHIQTAPLPVRGEQGSPAKNGCPFYKRCPKADIHCANVQPQHRWIAERLILCHKV
jgi:dipeptide transport system ATP-binding protein